jgi:hypothetical protein
MLNTDLMVTLFKAGAMPALEYSVGLWGVGCVQSKGWDEVETFWFSVAKYILHAPIRAQRTAIMGDLNWLPFSVRAGHQAAKFWTRVSKMNDSCLVRKAMVVQRHLANKCEPCWLSNFKVMLMSLNDHGINNIWNEWICDNEASRFLRRSMSNKRLRFDETQAGTVAREELLNSSV